jgi:hypothetical protein
MERTVQPVQWRGNVILDVPGEVRGSDADELPQAHDREVGRQALHAEPLAGFRAGQQRIALGRRGRSQAPREELRQHGHQLADHDGDLLDGRGGGDGVGVDDHGGASPGGRLNRSRSQRSSDPASNRGPSVPEPRS